jgi:hypothetical protein
MEYLRIDPRIDEHPDVISVGFIGSTVFQVILRACATFDKRGRLPAKFTPAWLARRLNIGDDDTSLPPETFVRMGIEKCVGVGLLERDGEDLLIPGWERFYTPPDLSTDRVRKHRQVKRPETDETFPPFHGTEVKQHETDETPETDETALTHSTEPTPLHVTERRTERPDNTPALNWLTFSDNERAKAYPRAMQDPPKPHAFLAWYREAIAVIPDPVLRRAYSAFLRDPWASKLTPPCPWDAWAKKWRGFVPNQTGGPPRNIPKPLKPGEVEHA